MLKNIKQILKVEFVKNVLIVAGGTAVAQIIYFSMMPFITRIYGPEAYGSLGIFVALLNIIGPIVALSYPISIILPKDNEKANSLIQLSVLISLSFSFLAGVIILLESATISRLLNIDAYILLVLPFTILFSGFFQIAEQLTIRLQQYKVNAKTAVIQALFDNSAKLGVGLVFPASISLIIIQTVGVLLRPLLIFNLLKDDSMKRILTFNLFKIINVAKEYKDFPLFRSPQLFVNSLSLTFPIIFLTIAFGPAVAGFYEISRQSLTTPVNLLGKAVQDVFYPKINDIYNSYGKVTATLTKLVVSLVFLGALPFGSVILFGPELFAFVFGKEWMAAGYYARWIALMSFAMLISRPVISIIPVLKLQGEFLAYEICSTIFRVGSLMIGVFYFKDSVEAIALFSFSSMISYLYLIVYVFLKSKKSDGQRKGMAENTK